MKGSYKIKVHDHRVTFELKIERNITVICGDSATGKTTLVNSIRSYEEEGENSGVTIESQKECRVLSGKDWEERLQKIHDSFVFIDEGSRFVVTKEFARAIKESDNYYIFITRENLYELPYSVTSVLEMKKTTSRFKHTYNKTYPRYDYIEKLEDVMKEFRAFMTEDTNSGFDLFSCIATKNGLVCLSAEGKDSIVRKLRDVKDEKVIVVADGAAFGANMAELYRYSRMHEDKILLYLPESTEWLILSSGIIKDTEISMILASPGDFIESSSFFSWEQFFTYLLVEKTKNSRAAYAKKKLPKYYMSDNNIQKIIAVIKEGL